MPTKDWLEDARNLGDQVAQMVETTRVKMLTSCQLSYDSRSRQEQFCVTATVCGFYVHWVSSLLLRAGGWECRYFVGMPVMTALETKFAGREPADFYEHVLGLGDSLWHAVEDAKVGLANYTPNFSADLVVMLPEIYERLLACIDEPARSQVEQPEMMTFMTAVRSGADTYGITKMVASCANTFMKQN